MIEASYCCLMQETRGYEKVPKRLSQGTDGSYSRRGGLYQYKFHVAPPMPVVCEYTITGLKLIDYYPLDFYIPNLLILRTSDKQLITSPDMASPVHVSSFKVLDHKYRAHVQYTSIKRIAEHTISLDLN